MRIDYYAAYCDACEAAASAKLGRSLTEQERAGVRNAGSGMMLEMVERTISEHSGPGLSAELSKAGLAFAARFEHALDQARLQLESLLKRTIDEEELKAMRAKRFIPELSLLLNAVSSVFFRYKREAVFRKELFQVERKRSLAADGSSQ